MAQTESRRKNNPLCLCGCGERVKWGYWKNDWCKFVSGHNSRIDHGMKGKKHSKETREKMSVNGKGKIPWNKGLEGLKGSWEKGTKPETLTHKGCKHSEETKKKMSQIKINQGLTEAFKIGKEWSKNNNPNHGMGGKHHSEETKAKIRKKIKRLWKNEDYSNMMWEARSIKPNKPETFILNLLEDLYPGEWKYTGDFSFMINGKNPDFVNVNGQKKIIEVFGDYWHDGDNPQDRIDIFKPFGYNTLIIWEHELEDIYSLIKNIKEFSEKRFD